MDIIEIQCPNCGGTIQRKKDEYFAVCPYCGGEVGFNELKEEAAVTGMHSKLESLDRHYQNEKEYMSVKARRKKGLLISYAIATLIYLTGAVLTSFGEEDSPMLGAGVICILCAFAVYLTSAAVFASSFTVFNFEKGVSETSKPIRFLMWLKLTGIGFLLVFLATVAAFLICDAFTGEFVV